MEYDLLAWILVSIGEYLSSHKLEFSMFSEDVSDDFSNRVSSLVFGENKIPLATSWIIVNFYGGHVEKLNKI